MKRYKVFLIIAVLMMGLELFGGNGYEKLKTGNGIYNRGIAGSKNSVFSVNFVSKSNYPGNYKPFHPRWSLRRSPVITVTNGVFQLQDVQRPIFESPPVPEIFGFTYKVTPNNKMYKTGIKAWPVKVTGDMILMARKDYVDRSEIKEQRLQRKIDPLTMKIDRIGQKNTELVEQGALIIQEHGGLNGPREFAAYTALSDATKGLRKQKDNLILKKDYFTEKRKEILMEIEYAKDEISLTAALIKDPNYGMPKLGTFYPFQE